MFAEFLARKSICHERMIPETPEQNGIGERMNRTLVEGKGQNDVDRCQVEPRFVGRGCGRSQLPTKQMPHKGSVKDDSRRSLDNERSGIQNPKNRSSLGTAKPAKDTVLWTASKEESTNPLPYPDVGEEAVIVWTSQDCGSTEMDPNPSHPPIPSC
ncbi:hypothetical protein T10_11706 [Trichinella papuae]|uniref:Integrase catalytic domain-containing protein n=1 Tax=Trichinella papuae TaxID=268474 RepID=A0A0V1MAX5_9BILA|nr:hypothetical protein T10_11706 [Trichinella papuae]